MYLSFFFFNDTATTEIYTLSLHDALPISDISLFSLDRGGRDPTKVPHTAHFPRFVSPARMRTAKCTPPRDRKSTRLNSSHANISYAVFCLKKKKKLYTRLPREWIRTQLVH